MPTFLAANKAKFVQRGCKLALREALMAIRQAGEASCPGKTAFRGFVMLRVESKRVRDLCSTFVRKEGTAGSIRTPSSLFP